MRASLLPRASRLPRPINRTAGLNFLSSANRNLLLLLLVVFIAVLFSIGAETVLFWLPRLPDSTAPRGIITGITVVVMWFALVGGSIAQSVEVYHYGKIINSPSCGWFLIPVSVFFIGSIPLFAYAILFYTS